MVLHWSLSDSKSPQVSRTCLRILSNAVVWIVSTCPPISKPSRPFINPLVIVPNAPITIVTFMFHSFFNSLARSRYLSFFSLSFRFILWSAGTAKSTILQIFFFCWLSWSLVFWPGLSDPFVCYSPILYYYYYYYYSWDKNQFLFINITELKKKKIIAISELNTFLAIIIIITTLHLIISVLKDLLM